MEGIQIYELKRMDLRGATVIDGFPSVGLVSSIVANYLINALNLTQIGIMDSIYFPTVALVRDGQPMNPVRIYAGPKVDDRDQIVVFISEFQPPASSESEVLVQVSPGSGRGHAQATSAWRPRP